jgi:hypothetical protein
VDQVAQGAEGLRDVGSGARPVHLVQVDVVGLQAPQRALGLALLASWAATTLIHEPAAGSTAATTGKKD